jgi:hypothetical protein
MEYGFPYADYAQDHRKETEEIEQLKEYVTSIISSDSYTGFNRKGYEMFEDFWRAGYEKVAFNLRDARKATTALAQKHPIVRGGNLVRPSLQADVSSYVRRPRANPSEGWSLVGPSADVDYNIGSKAFNLNQVSKAPLREAFTAPITAGPIMTGGGGPAQTFNIARDAGLTKMLPKTPQAKEMLNRMGLLHEGWEREVALKSPTMLDTFRAWGKPLNAGHMGPSVILNENNLTATLPSQLKSQLKPMLTAMRKRDDSWTTIQQALGRDIPYGSMRFSRHAKKRMLQAMLSKTPDEKFLSQLAPQVAKKRPMARRAAIKKPKE